MVSIGIDFKVEGRLLAPDLTFRTHDHPETFLIGFGRVHSGILVNAREFVVHIGNILKRRKNFLRQGFGRLIQVLLVVLFMLHKPAALIIHPDSPQEIYGLRAITLKHGITSFLRHFNTKNMVCPTSIFMIYC